MGRSYDYWMSSQVRHHELCECEDCCESHSDLYQGYYLSHFEDDSYDDESVRTDEPIIWDDEPRPKFFWNR